MILIELYHKRINHYTMSCLLFIHFTIYLGVITMVPCFHCGKSLLWGPELRLENKNATDPFRFRVKCVISPLLSRATGTSVNSNAFCQLCPQGRKSASMLSVGVPSSKGLICLKEKFRWIRCLSRKEQCHILSFVYFDYSFARKTHVH